LRGNKLREIDFGKTLEWVRYGQIGNAGIITQLELLEGQRRMTGAVDTCVTAIIIFALFKRGTRLLKRCGNLQKYFLIADIRHVTLHGTSTSIHAVNSNSLYHREKNQ